MIHSWFIWFISVNQFKLFSSINLFKTNSWFNGSFESTSTLIQFLLISLCSLKFPLMEEKFISQQILNINMKIHIKYCLYISWRFVIVCETGVKHMAIIRLEGKLRNDLNTCEMLWWPTWQGSGDGALVQRNSFTCVIEGLQRDDVMRAGLCKHTQTQTPEELEMRPFTAVINMHRQWG